MASLDGCRVLLVEDEYLLAQDLRNALEDMGVEVIGPEASVERALRRVAGEPRIDAAILDVNLGGELVFPVADALLARQIPFVFSSGYEDNVTHDRYPDVVKCDKPLNKGSLMAALQTLVVGCSSHAVDAT